jgi:hypothetical protein
MPEVNLEDFERKLRAAGSGQGGVEDPLEELTRLVNTIANDRPRDDRVIDFSAARQSPRPAPPPAPQLLLDEGEPEFAPPPEVYANPRRSLPASNEDAPPLEAPLLRPTFDEQPEPVAEALPETANAAEAAPAVEAAAPPRSRRPSWYWKTGGLVACALVAAPIAYTLKFGGAGAGSKAPPMILAASGPNKVAPPDETTVQSAQDTGALLNKDSTVPGPVKVVSNQEQPVDAPVKGDSPVAPMKDSPIIAPNQGPIVIQPAAANPPPAPVPPAPQAVAPAPPPVAPTESLPKGPKTVSVRPDGTLIVAGAATNYTPAAAASTPLPTPAKPEPAPSVTTQSASPTLALPPVKPPKSSQRVAVGKTDTTAPTEPLSAPLQLGSAAPEKPAKLPTKLSPPQRVADAGAGAADAPPTASGGEWAVQLAAPRSDAEAQSSIQSLQTKYGSELGDRELGVKKADVKGETIYRVRVSGLSKADATALCVKLKAAGADCFPARN